MRRLFTPYLFPGLPQLYYHGSPAGWVVALAYVFFAMFVVSATIVWEEIIPRGSGTPLVGMFVVAWFLGVFLSWRKEADYCAKEEKRREDFSKNDPIYFAQTAYLRRDWFEAERLLRERLSNWPEDVPCRILLAAILRRKDNA